MRLVLATRCKHAWPHMDMGDDKIGSSAMLQRQAQNMVENNAMSAHFNVQICILSKPGTYAEIGVRVRLLVILSMELSFFFLHK